MLKDEYIANIEDGNTHLLFLWFQSNLNSLYFRREQHNWAFKNSLCRCFLRWLHVRNALVTIYKIIFKKVIKFRLVYKSNTFLNPLGFVLNCTRKYNYIGLLILRAVGISSTKKLIKLRSHWKKSSNLLSSPLEVC